jgi:hypothetical protein
MSAVARSQDQLGGRHFGLELRIRNNPGRRKGNDRLLIAVRQGDRRIHPDNAPMVIVEAAWVRLRDLPPEVH